MIDDSLFNSVSQNAHWLAGLAWIFGSVVLFGENAIWYSSVAAVALAAFKEFWYDYRYETDEVRGSSLEDFAFYVVGIIGAIIICEIKWRYFL